MKKILLSLSIFISITMYSQDKKTIKILEEAKLLYRLEKGSWYGTDHFVENYKSKVDSIGGYLSYETPNHKICTIFYSKYDSNHILKRYEFDSHPALNNITVDTSNKIASDLETNLIKLRENTLNAIDENKKSFFRFYKNTSLNFIPVIRGKKREVFILTASKTDPVVIIGNDYKLSFNKKNELVKKEKFHKSLLKFPFTSKEKDNPLTTITYSSVMNKYITSTDICSLLLYKDYVEWNQLIVMNNKFVSIFDIKNQNLAIMKYKNWKKIGGNN